MLTENELFDKLNFDNITIINQDNKRFNYAITVYDKNNVINHKI